MLPANVATGGASLSLVRLIRVALRSWFLCETFRFISSWRLWQWGFGSWQAASLSTSSLIIQLVVCRLSSTWPLSTNEFGARRHPPSF
jgi:hypothetical protein